MNNQMKEPPHHKCGICDDDGICKNNINNPNYTDDLFKGGDLYDCQEYIEKRDGVPIGSWMRFWSRALQKEKEEPSDFSVWNKSLKPKKRRSRWD